MDEPIYVARKVEGRYDQMEARSDSAVRTKVTRPSEPSQASAIYLVSCIIPSRAEFVQSISLHVLHPGLGPAKHRAVHDVRMGHQVIHNRRHRPYLKNVRAKKKCKHTRTRAAAIRFQRRRVGGDETRRDETGALMHPHQQRRQQTINLLVPWDDWQHQVTNFMNES